MRVFHVCADRGVAPDGTKGASVHLRASAVAMARRGWSVVLFSATPAGDGFPVPVRPLEGPDALRGATLELGRPDIVYERYSLGHVDGLDQARSIGAPFVLEVNAPLHMEATRHRPKTVRPGDDAREQRLFREADLVVAVSEPLRSHIEAVRGTAHGTVTVRNGFWPEMFSRGRPSRDRDRTLAFLGNPKPFHGLSTLRSLVPDLVARGHDVRLLLIGGGPLADASVADAERRGVADRFSCTGSLPQAEAVGRLRDASVGLAPYDDDGFFYFCPLKVIEYMAAGLAIVAPALGDLPAILGDAAVLVPAGDADAFVDAVSSLLADRERVDALGERARERAYASFTWDHVAGRLSTAIASVATKVDG